MSVCRVQIIPVTQAPHIAMEEIRGVRGALVHTRAIEVRSMPYLPNFKRIAARTIEPATGASTCALGSQRWVVNKGIFTMKAEIVINHHSGINLLFVTGGFHIMIEKDRWLLVWYIHISLISSGKEAVIVYIIRYIPAWSRSGWYPHAIIRSIVGINEASKAT